MRLDTLSRAAKACIPSLPGVASVPALAVMGCWLLLSGQGGPQDWYKQSDFYVSAGSRVQWTDPRTGQSEVVLQVTAEDELSLGEQAFQALIAGKAVVQDRAVREYFERLVAELVNGTGGPPYPFAVTVLQAADVGDVVAPPGHVVISSGLAARCENEAMMAAAVAHAVAHAFAHHVTRRLVRAGQAQAGSTDGGESRPDRAAVSKQFATLSAQLGVELFSRQCSRSEEQEADFYTAQLLYHARRNPKWASDLFPRLEGKPVQFLSVHPVVEERAAYVDQYLRDAGLALDAPADSAEYQDVRTRLKNPSAPPPAPGTETGSPPVAGPPPVPPEPSPKPPIQPGPPPGPVPPPSPAGFPPDLKLPVPPPASSGVIVWSGQLDKDEIFTIEGDRATVGRLNGGLPGLPVQIDVDAREFAVVEPPGPSNGWKKLVIRSRNKRHTVVVVQWKIIPPGG